MHRLAIAITHPIQYHAPMYGYLARDGRFDVKVFYMSDMGSRPFYDPFAKAMVKYDNPILDGYEYEFLKQGAPKGWWQKRTEFIDFGLAKRLVDWAPDAVYFHGYNNPAFLTAMRACRKHGIGVLFRGENEDVIERPTWRNVLRETFLKMLLPMIDRVLYIGTSNKEFFRRRGVPESKLFFVPYSVDNDYFRAAYTAEQLRDIRQRVTARHGLRADDRLFIYTRKQRPVMRPLDAVRAFCDALPHTDGRAALLMCGDGELRQEAEAIARERGNGRVIFTGFIGQQELREHMLAADVMITPTEEPWGCAVNEGLACGLAQISSDRVVGWPDMVYAGKNGEVYPCGDVPALASIIARFAALSAAQIEAMKQASLQVADEMSFRTCADGLDAAMRSLPSRRRAPVQSTLVAGRA